MEFVFRGKETEFEVSPNPGAGLNLTNFRATESRRPHKQATVSLLENPTLESVLEKLHFRPVFS